MQQAPGDLPKPAAMTNVAPPVSPVAPSWKQEAARVVEEPEVSSAPSADCASFAGRDCRFGLYRVGRDRVGEPPGAGTRENAEEGKPTE